MLDDYALASDVGRPARRGQHGGGRPTSWETLEPITNMRRRAGRICTTMPKQFQGIVVAF
jgi:hypothetical protein